MCVNWFGWYELGRTDQSYGYGLKTADILKPLTKQLNYPVSTDI